MRRNVIRMMCLFFVSMGLCGCEGSSSTTATTAAGKFAVDAPVEGLKYVSGGQNGFTGPNGEFTYDVGQAVTFSVGGVVVGQAQGASVITPIELVKTAYPSATVTASTPAVAQITQFLLTASSLTSSGSKIDPTATSACASQNINISTAPPSSFSLLISQIAATAGNRPVTTASASVSLYMRAGSVQCAAGGLSLIEMQRKLTDAGIQVLTANCGSDGMAHIALCGADDGRIGIFEVPATQAQDALVLGFEPLSGLPDATTVVCRPANPATPSCSTPLTIAGTYDSRAPGVIITVKPEYDVITEANRLSTLYNVPVSRTYTSINAFYSNVTSTSILNQLQCDQSIKAIEYNGLVHTN